MKLADMCWVIRINKAGGLSHVNVFSKKAVKEGILYVKLTKLPASRDRNCKNSTDCGRFNDRTECFLIIDALSLVESLGNKSCFVAIHSAVRKTLDPKNPFTTNCVLRR